VSDLINIYQRLLTAYGPRHWWPAETPFEMMVGAILTQNTAWSNVEKAIAAFAGRLAPDFVDQVDLAVLAGIIRSSGYHNQKALRLKTLTRWFAGYGYDVNAAMRLNGDLLRQELLGLNGIGPETADSILLYALRKEYFVVDAYTRRIFARLGEVVPDKYDDFRQKIESRLPRCTEVYGEFHALLVEHAKRHCRKKPACDGCPLASSCVFVREQS
jgi:endonuclease-3 related protein